MFEYLLFVSPSIEQFDIFDIEYIERLLGGPSSDFLDVT